MRKIISVVSFSIMCYFMISACGNGPKTATVLEEGGRFYIIDDTGKKWDVTHAKEKYGMEPSKFQYGLGPYAIKPLINPQMLTEGSAGYPDDSDDMEVVGVDFEGETRAYPISIMTEREISNELLGEAHVAVAY